MATGRSSIGLNEPMEIAGRSMLDISSTIVTLINRKLGKGESLAEDELSSATMDALKRMVRELQGIPKEALPWHEQLKRKDT